MKTKEKKKRKEKQGEINKSPNVGNGVIDSSSETGTVNVSTSIIL